MQVNIYSPSFCGYHSEFGKKLNRYLNEPVYDTVEEKGIVDVFSKIVAKKMSPANEMGRGCHGTVYAIDDDYVFKIANRAKPLIGTISIIKDEAVKNLKTYYGNVIARIGNMEIMKNAFKSKDILPAGLPMRWMPRVEKLEYYNTIYLKRFVELPQSAYDKVAEDFKTLNSLGKEFDTKNPNNFTADGDEIKIVDEISDAYDTNPNTLAKLFKVFINSYDVSQTAEFDYLAVSRRKDLIKKLILASEKAELPFYCNMNDRAEIKLAFDLCDCPEGFSNIQRTLMDYRRKYPDMNMRLQKISEFLDEYNKPDVETISFYC